MGTMHHEHFEKGVQPETEQQKAAQAGTKAPEGQGRPSPDQKSAAAKPENKAEAGDVAALKARIEELEKAKAASEQETAGLKAQLAQSSDKYLRAMADGENQRKRLQRQRDEDMKYANEGLLRDLIKVMDDFDRALASSDQSKDYKVLYDGVSMIKSNFAGLFGKYGAEKYEAQGELFDPNLHEAVASEPGDVAEPTVSVVFQPGYRLHDRVLRHARVKVQMPAPKADAAAQPESGTKSSDSGKKDDDVSKS